MPSARAASPSASAPSSAARSAGGVAAQAGKAARAAATARSTSAGVPAGTAASSCSVVGLTTVSRSDPEGASQSPFTNTEPSSEGICTDVVTSPTYVLDSPTPLCHLPVTGLDQYGPVRASHQADQEDGGMHRNKRTAAVAGVVAALVLGAAGCGDDQDNADPAAQTSQAKDITVWLMNGSAPDAVIKAVNADFTAAHPGTTVKVEIQQWDGIQEKTTTALAGNNPPDVLEIGNTLVSKFAESGGLADLTDKKSDLGGDSWLQGLTDAGTLDGKLYGVPYYAGDRAVIYRKDLFAKAGITSPPTDRASFVAAADKLQRTFGSDPKFSALYFPGQYWYAALPFVWDEGGDIAVQDGDAWKGTLDSAESQAGLSWLKDVVQKYSKAPVNGNENDNDPAVPLGEGKAAMIIDPGWKVGVVTKNEPALKNQIAVFPIPGKSADRTAPVFLGGSNLAVAEGSDAPDLAYEWVKLLAGEKAQTQLATVGGVIPNTTSLLDLHAKDPILSVFDTAAKNSKFTPATPKWANVESSTILQDMLVAIFSDKKTVADATRDASEAITKTLNE